jgi:hypothetical protein
MGGSCTGHECPPLRCDARPSAGADIPTPPPPSVEERVEGLRGLGTTASQQRDRIIDYLLLVSLVVRDRSYALYLPKNTTLSQQALNYMDGRS